MSTLGFVKHPEFKQKLRQWLSFYGKNFDVDDPRFKKFLEDFEESVDLLIPTGMNLLVDNGLEDDIDVPFLFFIIYGDLIKGKGEQALASMRKDKGETHETNDNVIVDLFKSKLYN